MKQQGDILIVDDTPANLRLLSQMLRSQGYTVRAVTSGARAIDSVHASMPNLILLDIRMPDMDGYEVCEELKAFERTRDIPIIFISALNEIEDKVKAFKVGGVDYITKPFQLDEVLARTETHLALRKLQLQQQKAIKKLERELRMAGKLQSSFLPSKIPAYPGWDICSKLVPANETSGDFYDIFDLPDGRLGFIVADVVDKGVVAALFMALCWGLIRTYAPLHADEPHVAFEKVNKRILKDTGANEFVTVFYGVLDPNNGNFVYSNAGQSPPILVKTSKGRHVVKFKQTGPPLGILEQERWGCRDEVIDPGDILVMYTDGISEAQNLQGDFFDAEGLIDVLCSSSGKSALQIQEKVLDRLDEFSAGAHFYDDIALLVVVRKRH